MLSSVTDQLAVAVHPHRGETPRPPKCRDKGAMVPPRLTPSRSSLGDGGARASHHLRVKSTLSPSNPERRQSYFSHASRRQERAIEVGPCQHCTGSYFQAWMGHCPPTTSTGVTRAYSTQLGPLLLLHPHDLPVGTLKPDSCSFESTNDHNHRQHSLARHFGVPTTGPKSILIAPCKWLCLI